MSLALKNAFQPTSLVELIKFAEMLAKSSMVPKDYQGRPENILVAAQWGAEIGLGILQSVQNISIINGRPSIWGDAALALVRGSSLCEYVRETISGEGDQMVATCCIKRRGEEEVVVKFSASDAKKAGLWSKTGTWQQYPGRMLQMRARGFGLRDVFPDVLRGVITAEEAEDYPAADPIPAVAHRPAPVVEHDAAPLSDMLEQRTMAARKAYDEAATRKRIRQLETHIPPLVTELQEAGRADLIEALNASREGSFARVVEADE